MFNYIWPLALVVVSNTIYHICAKSISDDISPLASLTVTYLVGAVASGVLYYCITPHANLFREYGKLNWAPFVLGLAIVGLEAGFLYAYKAGWPVSTAQIVSSAVLAVALIFVGWLIYKEQMSVYKIIGVLICLVGLVVINYTE